MTDLDSVHFDFLHLHFGSYKKSVTDMNETVPFLITFETHAPKTWSTMFCLPQRICFTCIPHLATVTDMIETVPFLITFEMHAHKIWNTMYCLLQRNISHVCLFSHWFIHDHIHMSICTNTQYTGIVEVDKFANLKKFAYDKV